MEDNNTVLVRDQQGALRVRDQGLGKSGVPRKHCNYSFLEKTKDSL